MSTRNAQTESKVFHRSVNAQQLAVASGRGCTLVLEDGREVLDGAAGAAVACLGHGNRYVQQAILSQMDKISYIHAQVYTSGLIEELAALLVESTGDQMSRVVFTSSGSESMEVSMKLARQYHLEKDPPQPQRDLFLSRQQSYHGATLGTLALSGHVNRRARYEPLMLNNMRKTAVCNPYRGQGVHESDRAYVDRLASCLEEDIKACGPDRICAFVAETISGASLGCAPPVAGYFQAVRAICDKYDILLILDEIMCGVGRTGTMHAWEQEGVVPDIQAVAKGLGGGYVPIGAVLLNHKVFDTMAAGSGVLSHGQTYQSHLLACAAALEVQRCLQKDKLVDRCRDIGHYLLCRLKARLGEMPFVGDIRGRGLFVGVELVADKKSKEPFPSAKNIAGQVHAAALRHGLATYPGTGTADGVRGDHILLAPPFIITTDEIDSLVLSLGKAITDVTKEFHH